MARARKLDTWRGWLEACIREPGNPVHDEGRLMPEHLGALTGQDSRALDAIAACWELLAASDDGEPVLAAVRSLLTQLQPQCHRFARELVARSLDWDDRIRVWALTVRF